MEQKNIYIYSKNVYNVDDISILTLIKSIVYTCRLLNNVFIALATFSTRCYYTFGPTGSFATKYFAGTISKPIGVTGLRIGKVGKDLVLVSLDERLI